MTPVRPRRPRSRRLRLAVAGLAVSLFAALGIIAGREKAPSFDQHIMAAMRTPDSGQPVGPHWLPHVARDITSLGSAAVLVPFSALLSGWLALRGRRAAAGLLLVAGLGGYLLNSTLKQGYGRERPDIAWRLVQIDSASFPSGHATAAAAAYFAAALILGAHRAVGERRFLFAAVGVVVLAVGVSRIYLGVHFPSDVLAGWIAGSAWAVLCAATARWLEQRGRTPSVPAPPM